MTVAALVGFARALRDAGVVADAHRVPAMLAAVDLLGVDELYWAGRLTLCAEPDDLPIYDRVFRTYFGNSTKRQPLPTAPTMPSMTAPFVGGTPGAAGDDEEEGTVGVSTSTVEILRTRDVAALTARERAEVRRLLALLTPGTAPRRTRRRRPASRGEVDARGTVRALIRNGGEPTALRRRGRLRRPRRLVLLVDVSGSMTPYADALLRFAHAAVRLRPTRTEVFTLGTRLTRVTRAFRHRDPDAAQTAAGAVIPDWHGGTRLADSLRAFVDRWGQRGTARGAVVVICSDGWERGDPALLAAQVGRLHRLAYRLVWVNPHRGKSGYAPLAGGMAAALPFCDDFVAGHSLDALEELVRVIARA
ncbi:vWA domain-containing protein [Virgisporangium aurantiacum]|uniref:VWA domain-containing protein n=1 Tax=Virgisporangium aurantiacum TaxID=175570 RepID=A0A8J3Z5Y9_9ACTN|nr:VWA domain-containing protein [Virgisporangium aurantiacum]GIJ58099.1 VWA domain-containing protein [Virgisporangium aurantiacum]